MKPFTSRLTAGSAAAALALVGFASPAMADHTPGHVGSAGDDTLVVPINDSTAGGTYDQEFEKAYTGATEDGTPVYVYVPVGAIENPTVRSMDPKFDPTPGDEFIPCGQGVWAAGV